MPFYNSRRRYDRTHWTSARYPPGRFWYQPVWCSAPRLTRDQTINHRHIYSPARHLVTDLTTVSATVTAVGPATVTAVVTATVTADTLCGSCLNSTNMNIRARSTQPSMEVRNELPVGGEFEYTLRTSSNYLNDERCSSMNCNGRRMISLPSVEIFPLCPILRIFREQSLFFAFFPLKPKILDL